MFAERKSFHTHRQCVGEGVQGKRQNDIGQAGNELDSQYMAFMATLRGGIVENKLKNRGRLDRLKNAEQNSEAARVLRIVNAPPPPDRVPPPPTQEHHQPAWARATNAPRPSLGVQELPLPPAEDIGGRKQFLHEASLMKSIVAPYQAGTSNYKTGEMPVEQINDNFGTNGNRIGQMFSRPSFLFERTDDDVAPSLPPQVSAVKAGTFRDTEDSTIPTRSDGLEVDLTPGSDMFHIPQGAAVVQPSLQLPLNDATLCLPPIAASIAVHERGTAAHGAALRSKDLGYINQPELAAPTKIAYTVGADTIPPSIRFSSDDHLQPVVGPNISGRTEAGSLPAAETRMDRTRFDASELLAAESARLQQELQAVSGSAYVGATPAIVSGDDGARLRRIEELEKLMAQTQQQLQQISGRTELGALPANMHIDPKKVEAERLLAAYSRRHQTELGSSSGRPALGALPVSIEENEERSREARLLEYYSGVHKRELGLTSGRPEAQATPTVIDPERQHNLDLEEKRKAAEVVRQRDVNAVSNRANQGAAVAPPSHMPDDSKSASEPDGRGASTIARASAWKSEHKPRPEQATYNFYDAAVHGAHMGATVLQPYESTNDYVSEGLRTSDTRERLEVQREKANLGASAHSSAFATRGPDADVRTVSDHHLQPMGQNKNVGVLLPSAPPTSQEVQLGDFKHNVQTGVQKQNLGLAQPGAGERPRDQEIQNLKSSVHPDRPVAPSGMYERRRVALGASQRPVGIVHAPLRHTKDDQLSQIDAVRSNFALPVSVQPTSRPSTGAVSSSNSTKTIRDLLRERQVLGSTHSMNADMSRTGAVRCVRS
jgi:hypothetical protein